MAEHGTHARYSKGCRCEDCLVGHRIYEREAARRRRRIKYGIELPKQRLTDAQPVRDHIQFLSSKGIGLGAIAQQTGTYRSTIQRIRRGRTTSTTTELAEKILAIPAIPRVPMAFTDAKPLLDLLKDLEKKGVSRNDVGRVLGYRYGRLAIKNKVRVWRYNQIEAVCKEMLRQRP